MTFAEALAFLDDVIAARQAETKQSLRDHGISEAQIESMMAESEAACRRERAAVVAWMQRGCKSLH